MSRHLVEFDIDVDADTTECWRFYTRVHGSAVEVVTADCGGAHRWPARLSTAEMVAVTEHALAAAGHAPDACDWDECEVRSLLAGAYDKARGAA